MTVRLEPEVYDWVKEQGGGSWLRHVATELHGLAGDPDFKKWWTRFDISTDA